jgi:hypothetical protein
LLRQRPRGGSQFQKLGRQLLDGRKAALGVLWQSLGKK